MAGTAVPVVFVRASAPAVFVMALVLAVSVTALVLAVSIRPSAVGYRACNRSATENWAEELKAAAHCSIFLVEKASHLSEAD